MKLKLCCYTGCTAVTNGEYYCPKHKEIMARRNREKNIFTQRGASGEYNSWYRTARWRRERAEFLQAHPFCVQCGAPSKIVDHIIPHRGNEELFWNQENWQPLCMSCHSAKTLRENGFFHKEKA